MTLFNVLDRGESVHRHALLEASAGTGKTFTIENIVCRLLIESNENQEPISLEKILAVTFTRAAARELKDRIHTILEKNLAILVQAESSGEIPHAAPDYILKHIEQGPSAIAAARRRIESALHTFDRAQIFTIHGFCWRMLKTYAMQAQMSFAAVCREELAPVSTLLDQAIRDFLRTQLTLPAYSPKQLKLLIKIGKQQNGDLESQLLKEASKGIDTAPTPTFGSLLEKFVATMSALKAQYAFESDLVLADLLKHVPAYTGLQNIQKQIKLPFLRKIERLAALFSKEQWNAADLDVLIDDGLICAEQFAPINLKKKSTPPQAHELNYPRLLTILDQALNPIVSIARNPAALFSRVVSDCRHFLKAFQDKEEIFGHTDLLIQMRAVVNRPAFAAKVRQTYQAVIVDEFQDTDPLQWEIFSTLFAQLQEPWNGYLHLVGDPKQSIYAFRQADIYTYLDAAATLGPSAQATLDTNFRSIPPLVAALNAIFSSVHGIFSLPRLAKVLEYRQVKAGKPLTTQSNRCLNFWGTHASGSTKTLETEVFFPAIADEIIRLHQESNIKPDQCAILISDRYQGYRLETYLKSRGLGVKSQRGKELWASPVVDAMQELLQGIYSFQSRSALKIALGGRLIGMTHDQLLTLDADETRLLPLLQKCAHLRSLLLETGWAGCYPVLLQTAWHADQKSMLERLLEQEGGGDFLRDWQDLAEILIEEQHARDLSTQDLIDFLDQMNHLSEDEKEPLKSTLDLDLEGVSVLTTHMSKGLEFEAVFTLSLISRKKLSENTLIPIKSEKGFHLTSSHRADSIFKQHCEELDAEKMRQLYVAFTRAKSRLYLPFIIDEKQNEIELGSASPMDLLLARLNRPERAYEGLYQQIACEDGSALQAFVEMYPALMGISYLKAHTTQHATRMPQSAPLLKAPQEVTIPCKIECIQSFSSLVSSKEAPAEVLLSPPHDYGIPNKTPHTLPAGNETGILLHKILENIPFDCGQNCATYASPFVSGTPFAEWKDTIVETVLNALNTPLPGTSSSFCLADVHPKKMFRETEFLYPCSASSTLKPGFIKGVVDLFFEHEGKYYVVDWKSNWLGPGNDNYGSKTMQEAMQANDYTLQAAIYSGAMQRYLKLFDSRPFEEIFGGAYYIFLRGISPTTGILKV